MFLALLMYLSWLAWGRENRLGEAGRINEWVVHLFTGTLTLACILFFAFVPLPRAYYPEIWFHRPEEFAPAVFFLLALVGYLRKGHWRHDAFEHWLVLSLVVGLVGQTVFMSYSGQLFDFEFDAAHMLKKVSYICMLTGLSISMSSIFREAELGKARLARANVRLEGDIAQRRQIEEEIRTSSQVLRSTIDSFPGGIAVFDRDLRLVVANREFHNLLNFPLDHFPPGTPFEKFIRFNVERGEYGPGDPEMQIRERVERAKKFEAHQFERTVPDGRIVEIRGYPMPAGGFVTTYVDISERKLGEQILNDRLLELEETRGRSAPAICRPRGATLTLSWAWPVIARHCASPRLPVSSKPRRGRWRRHGKKQLALNG